MDVSGLYSLLDKRELLSSGALTMANGVLSFEGEAFVKEEEEGGGGEDENEDR